MCQVLKMGDVTGREVAKNTTIEHGIRLIEVMTMVGVAGSKQHESQDYTTTTAAASTFLIGIFVCVRAW